VSQLRWTATKAGALAATTVLGAGLITGLLSWWSRPFVTASDNRFALGVFGLRGTAPVGYALSALALGVAAGAVIRRTVPAMAATVAVYAAARAAVEIWLRPHFARPRTLSYPFFGQSPRSGLGDWVLSTRTTDATGHVLANSDSLNLELLATSTRVCASAPSRSRRRWTWRVTPPSSSLRRPSHSARHRDHRR
jgi:hypothetical protein